MPGDHAAPGLRRFYRELTGSLIRWFIIAAIIIVVVWGVSRLLDSLGGDPATTPTQPVATTEVPPPVTSTSTTSATTTSTTTTTSSTSTTTTTTLPAELPASEVQVIVLNSTTRSGLAAGVSDNLAEAGYQMLEPDNYRPTLDVSRIWFTPDFEDEAITLAGQIPQTMVVEPYPEDGAAPADIIVVLGADFGG